MYYKTTFFTFGPDIVSCDYSSNRVYNSPSGTGCSNDTRINYAKDCKPFSLLKKLLIKGDAPKKGQWPCDYEHLKENGTFPIFRFNADSLKKILNAIDPKNSEKIISNITEIAVKVVQAQAEIRCITEEAQQDLIKNEIVEKIFEQIHFQINKNYCIACPFRKMTHISSEIIYSDGYNEASVLKILEDIDNSTEVNVKRTSFQEDHNDVYSIGKNLVFEHYYAWGLNDSKLYLKTKDQLNLIFNERFYNQRNEFEISEKDKPWFKIDNKILTHILLNKLQQAKITYSR